MACKICNGMGVIDNGAIKGTDKHTYSECDCKKEKSVLTEDERREIAYSHHGGAEQYMSIVVATERAVLANYKKGLREKVEETIREVLNMPNLSKDHQVNLICHRLFCIEREMTDEEVKDALSDYTEGWKTSYREE